MSRLSAIMAVVLVGLVALGAVGSVAAASGSKKPFKLTIEAQTKKTVTLQWVVPPKTTGYVFLVDGAPVGRSKKGAQRTVKFWRANCTAPHSCAVQAVPSLVRASLSFGVKTSPAPTGCTTVVTSAGAVNPALAAAPDGGLVCLAAGSYGDLVIKVAKQADTTIGAQPGAAVTFGHVEFGGSSAHVVVSDVTVTGGLHFDAGSNSDTVTHSDLMDDSSGNIIYFDSCDSSRPNAPSGCNAEPPVVNASITYNKIHGCGPTSTTGEKCDEDAIRINNFQTLRIAYNDIYDVIEDPSYDEHNDGLQSVFGGSDLTFDHNYEHDNCSQNLFFKDGDLTGTTSVTDNLFVRNQTSPPGGCGQGLWTMQLFDTTNLILRNNTEWATGTVIQDDSPSGHYATTADHNVFSQFHNDPGDPASGSLTEGFNVLGKVSQTFTHASTDTVNPNPTFVNPATDDYELARNPNGIGIDWQPSQFVYGPRG